MNGADVQVTADEVERFARASHDRNPLHTSADYSRATPFGRPVVFGVLAGLRLLGSGAGVDAARPARVRMGFPRPVFEGHEYRIERDEASGVTSLLDDDERVSWVSQPDLAAAPTGPDLPIGADAPPPRTSAATWTVEAQTGDRVGSYPCDAALLRSLGGSGLDGLSDAELAALALPSYLAGMELPGRQALLTEVDVTLTGDGDGTARGLTWRAAVQRYQVRYRMVTVVGRLVQDGDTVVAEIRYRAMVRPDPFRLDLPAIEAQLPRSSFAGRRALVVGGSRGLGAVLAAQLALSGADVLVTYLASSAAATDLRDRLASAPGRIRAVRADAGDPDAWEPVRDLLADGPPLDLLVCSAWPALTRMSTGPAGIAAGLAHVSDGLAMVAGPLAAFLPAMTGARRDVLVLSSQLVSEPDAGFWHYTAGKAAAEQLCRTLATRHRDTRFVLARPPALATDYVSAAGADPLSPVIAGRRMLEFCADGDAAGVHLLETGFSAAATGH